MKFLVTAALALGMLGLTPATAQTTSTTTTTVATPGVERTVVRERPNGTVVRRTTTRRTEVRRSSYGQRRYVNRRVCTVKYRNNKRIRTCRMVRRYA